MKNTIDLLIEKARERAEKTFGGLIENDTDTDTIGNLPKHKAITAICAMLPEDDIGNAARLVLRHGKKFRFVEGKKGGVFFVFDGKRWSGSEHGQADLQDFAQNTVINIRHEVEFLKPSSDATKEEKDRAERAIIRRLKHAEKSGKSSSITSMIAQTRPAVKDREENFDVPEKTAHLFNVANGTINLETGKLKSHDPADMITQLSDIVFDPKAKAPTWDAFLWSVFEENAEKVQFFQRFVGYTMHGHQDEENVIFILGNEKAEKTNGSNGKSKLLEGVRQIFGDYGWSVKPSLICKTTQSTNRQSNDVADLYKKRIGIGSEFKETETIETDAFKRATGADKINAHRVFGDAFEFYSTATLFFTANKTPFFESGDNGILRRPIFLQLNRVFYKAHEHPNGIPEGGHVADLKLARKLRAEAQGILAWAVRGAVAYNTEGLNTPKELIEDRTARLETFDPLNDWMEACVEFDPTSQAKQGDMFESYRRFCEINATGDRNMTARAFGEKLTAKKIVRDKKGGEPWRLGVRLNEAGIGYSKGMTATTDTNRRIQHLKRVE